MAKDYFRISKGLSIDTSTVILYGSVAPSAASGIAAPVSSIYCRTSDGSTWHKTGALNTDWKQFLDSAGASVEDTYQNSFTGKTSTGAVLPSYTEENHVLDNDSLMAAIDKLDMYLGAGPSVNVRTNYPITSTGDVNANIQALDDAIGTDAQMTSLNYIATANSIDSNLSALDAAIKAKNPFAIVATNQPTSAGLAADTLALASYSSAEWFVTVKSYATNGNRATYKVVALNDGVSAIDYTLFAILTVGAAITGLDISVIITGSNMVLNIACGEAIDYNIQRIAQA